MTRRRRIALTGTLALALSGAAAGCGYHDGNPAAAGVVARALVNAYNQRDAATVCRVVIPGLATQFASEAGGSCSRHIAGTFAKHPTTVTLGVVRLTGLTGNQAKVYVQGSHSQFVDLLKLGSLWRVASSWQLR
jgi:hypothetical protein